MPSLKKWIEKRLSSSKKSRDTASTPGPLPFLPIERPSHLTPSHSRENLIALSAMSNYGLFQHMPYEIRRMIIIAAFGGQTLHLDLTFAHPLERMPGAQPNMNHCGLGYELVRNVNQPKDWQWFSCVCHRRARLTVLETWRRVGQKMKPDDDECLNGIPRGCDCEAWGGDWPGKCFIGIMGWLLSCRQAYADGVDILFTTNTFHLSNLELQESLPRLLLPHRLSSINSLELLWDFSTPQPNGTLLHVLWETPEAKDSPLHTLCRMVPEVFPNVHYLYISLQLRFWSPLAEFYDLISVLEQVILGSIEDMLRNLGLSSGREFNVAISRLAWDVLYQKNTDLDSSKVKCEGHMSNDRFWKPLGPPGIEVPEDHMLGYWICSGWDP